MKRAFVIEKEIAKKLKMHRVAFSGGRWWDKEDIKSVDYIGQIKSTRGKTLAVKHEAIESLVKNAVVTHKIPILILHFDAYDDTWIAMRVSDWKGSP